LENYETGHQKTSRVYKLLWQRTELTWGALLGRSRLERGCNSDIMMMMMMMMIMIYIILFIPNRNLQ